MLENVHLAPGWLMQLEKKLHSMQPHASFRLFLTMEINPKVNHIAHDHDQHFIFTEDFSDSSAMNQFSPSPTVYYVFLPGASESASSWTYLCV